MSDATSEVTQMLREWSAGDREALNRLIPEVESELRRRARGVVNAAGGSHTLQPTALVNELYLELVKQKRAHWNDRGHFFAIASAMMRRIIRQHARDQRAGKRGGGWNRITLDPELNLPGETVDFHALDLALDKLSRIDPRRALVAQLRGLGGLTAPEAADLLQISATTAKRDWLVARAWLSRELDSDHADER